MNGWFPIIQYRAFVQGLPLITSIITDLVVGGRNLGNPLDVTNVLCIKIGLDTMHNANNHAIILNLQCIYYVIA